MNIEHNGKVLSNKKRIKLKLIINIETSKYSLCLYLARKMKRWSLCVNTVTKLPFSIKGAELLDYQCLDNSAARVWSLELHPGLCFLSHQSITLEHILLLQWLCVAIILMLAKGSVTWTILEWVPLKKIFPRFLHANSYNFTESASSNKVGFIHDYHCNTRQNKWVAYRRWVQGK